MPSYPDTKEIVPAQVLEAVRDVAHDWMMFGIYLGVPYDRLLEIGGASDAGLCTMATLHTWITGTPQEATVHNLTSAVGGPLIGNKDLAQRIPAILDINSESS